MKWWIIFFLFSFVSFGEDGLRELPDQSVYAKDGLYLKVAIVDDPKEFLAEWSKQEVPAIKTRTSFHRGEVVFPAIMYSTNRLNPSGEADIVCTLLFRRPDGSIYENPQDLTVVKGVPPKSVGLSKARAGIKIEETDPFGEYTLKVTITDKIKEVTVEMLFHFSVIDPDAKPPDPIVTGSESLEDPIHPESAQSASPTPQPTSRVRPFSDDLR
ncbi:MAG: hypothetical protein D4R65_01950 [Verrucomicrobiaceae bacterium]|nr:MAG: hypothetical protein D4R65_01950 [Verrucomicrobiaceae bacterium]